MKPIRFIFRHYIITSSVVGATIAGIMIFTHTGPGIKPLPLPSNPENRNIIRREILNQISDALADYIGQHEGKLPIKLPMTDTAICSSFGTNCQAVKLIDLNFLVAGGYIDSLPMDPLGTKGRWNTGYTISQNPDGKIRLAAPNAELDAVISLVK